jgi:transcriptional regulator with GAF, ATPase, and Fis domain
VTNPDRLLESLERFAVTLTAGYGVGDVLHDLTSEMTDVLDLTGAGVTLVHDGKQRFVTAAVEAIASLERVQEDHQLGPCIDAVTTAQPITVSDLDVEDTTQRWPEYSNAAKTAGIRAVAGIPMLGEESAVGAVNLYVKTPRIWPPEDMRVASVFANIATAYLVHASAARQHQRTAEQLQQALNTRLIIEQAKGVLATQREIDIDEAFRLLRKHAREHNTRIHDVARAVIDGDLHLPVR